METSSSSSSSSDIQFPSTPFTLECCPKNPDNPLFANEKIKHEEYTNGLQSQVEMLKYKDPKKYQKYQGIGDYLMCCDYNDLQQGIDSEGDTINAKKLLYIVRDYGVEDLSLEEKKLVERVYGRDWNILIDTLL